MTNVIRPGVAWCPMDVFIRGEHFAISELPSATNVSRGQHEGMCWVLTAAVARGPTDKNVGKTP